MAKTAIQSAVLEPGGDPEARVIFRWRFDSLVRAGYPWNAAVILASHDAVDLHVATDLAARGCPPTTALRILL